MKPSLKFIISLIVLIMCSYPEGFGQEYIKLERSIFIDLQDQSSAKDYFLKINKEYNYLRIKIDARLKTGSSLIELIDPSGTVTRNFTIELGNQPGIDDIRIDRSGQVSGQSQKAFRNPTDGNWIVRINSKNANGKILIYSVQIFNPRTDLIELEEIEKNTNEYFR